MTHFMLVHSPLVGPSTWAWVADELAGAGHRVTVPVSGDAAANGGWHGFVDAVVAAAPAEEHLVLVGHSGAGLLLPAIADALAPARVDVALVDAVLPPVTGEVRLLPEPYLERLRAVAVDGIAPPWSEWFGPEAMATLVPDPDRRAAVLADLPTLPMTYFEASVPMPPSWATAQGSYVLLSELYGADAEAATARGWPVVELVGGHLDIVTRPAAIAASLVALAAAM